MTDRIPEVVIIGGPNGAGKSTFARYVLPESMPFLNADEIAKTLPSTFVGSREIESGRILLARMERLSAMRRSFAVETTLASRSLAPRLRQLISEGWRVYLYFIELPAPELSIERVAARVRRGGHDIPEETIRRRFDAGLRHLFDLYAPLVTESFRLRNETADGPVLIAHQKREESTAGPEASPLFSNLHEILRRARLAVQEVLRDHQLADNPVAIWKSDSVVVALPNELALTIPPQ